jgi:hypothetical protein
VTVSATASSGLPVSFTTTTPLVCTSTGTHDEIITLVKVGTCTVYNAANLVNRNVNVTQWCG